MANITEALLYAAARAQLVNEVIEPVLKDGGVVISDRFWIQVLYIRVLQEVWVKTL